MIEEQRELKGQGRWQNERLEKVETMRVYPYSYKQSTRSERTAEIL